MKKHLVILLALGSLFGCQTMDSSKSENPQVSREPVKLSLAQAEHLVQLPLSCVAEEYPNRLGQTLDDNSQLQPPHRLHPAFFGCFDWHSSVHGHWSLVMLLREYPQMSVADKARSALHNSLTAQNILAEVAYFDAPGSANYERPYGWAWLLKLAVELKTWDDPLARELSANLQPLATLIADKMTAFLPKLNYPMREGTHKNTAFAMSLAWDYAQGVGDQALVDAITDTVNRFYLNDKQCPLTWEPSGSDFLSPCFEEANIVRKVLSPKAFETWLTGFMPDLAQTGFVLEPGRVSDRADGHLVHLDGLNFSRAWCLYGIAQTLPQYGHLRELADEHIRYSLPSIVDDNYSGTHWLGSFALQALRFSQ